MRRLPRILDVILSVGGVMLIVAALLPELKPQQVGAVMVGALMIQAGVAKMSHLFFPDERRWLSARAEVDVFLTLMRQLNQAALALREKDSPENRRDFEELRDAMRAAVEQIAMVAGKTVERMAEEAGQPDAGTLWKNDFFAPPDDNPRSGS